MSAREDSKEQLESTRLEGLYRKASDPVLRTHLLMVWRMSVGDSIREVAEMVGYSEKWVREIARRYEREGVEGLGDRRHGNPGAKQRALLDGEGQARLRQALLEEAPPGGGMWSGPKVERWAEDEARLGLKPVIRRVWAPVGKRPVARFKRGYKWTYLYAFVHPNSGELYWLILPTVNTGLFSMALNEFAKEVGVGKDKRVLLVLDKAGWHTGKEVEVPEGIHLEFLPSGSPELQPAERLWPLTNEAVANGLFEEIEELEETLMERCLELLDQTETIKDLTNYHWWPQAA